MSNLKIEDFYSKNQPSSFDALKENEIENADSLFGGAALGGIKQDKDWPGLAEMKFSSQEEFMKFAEENGYSVSIADIEESDRLAVA
ncbi:MAG: hypothetical protein MUE53_09975 [Chitinophagales bacterium]|jgi:hypothetical protein|nr:hypothetical protein [Chitinophagales bacterium]